MTVGKQAADLLNKAPETRDPIELERAMQEDYLRNLIECVKTHKTVFNKDFFVVVLTKNERLLPNVFRNYFSARLSCPTPNYDQTVYLYNSKNDSIEYIWTVPGRDVCIHFIKHKNEIVKSEQQLLDFILKFADGSLMEQAKQFNKEIKESIQLEGMT